MLAFIHLKPNLEYKKLTQGNLTVKVRADVFNAFRNNLISDIKQRKLELV